MRQPEKRSRNRRGLLSAAVILVAMLLQPAVAWGSGGIDVRSASTRLQGGVWYLDAEIVYTLNETALEALDSGLVLDVELTIRLTQSRRIIWDATFAELRQRYELQYHALTERYIVRNLNSGEQASYGSLDGALRALGSVRFLPIIDDALLSRGDRYHVQMRAVIDIKQLGGPLAMIRILWNDWRITGDWKRWRLAD